MGINAVWGPPQSGKTTLAIDLAFALSRSRQSVCLISPELYSELAAKLNVQIVREKSLVAASKLKESLKQIVHTVDDLLYVLAAPFDNDAFGEDLSSESARNILKQADSLFDVVIVDCPSHTGSELAARAIGSAEHVFMMSGANSAAVLWYKAYHRAIEAVESNVCQICAEVSDAFDYRTLHTMLDVIPEVWLPHISNAGVIQIAKRTLYQGNGKIMRKYTQRIDKICTILNGKEEPK